MMNAKFPGSLRYVVLVLAFCAGIASDSFAAETPAAPAEDALAKSIVKKADTVRFPQEGFQVDVVITTAHPGDSSDVRKYRVLSKGNENSVVMVTEPASERGQIMLMKERDLWMFLPEVSQPVRLALSQRLTGQVANGDLARANFSEIGRAHV